jgi:integrase
MPRTNLKAASFKKRVREWKKEHPDWDEEEPIKLLNSLLSSESSKKNYYYALPWFFAFVDKTPTEVIEERKAHIAENPPNRHYENEAIRYKRHLVNLEYSAKTTNGYISIMSGFFTMVHPSYQLNVPKSFWDLEESPNRTATRKRKQPPSNEEIRAIYAIADRKTRIALLLGYQAGLAPVDCLKLTWSNLNIDFDTEDRDFISLEHHRSKTGVQGEIILNPDLLYILKAEWIAQRKPDEGYILQYRGAPLQTRHPNLWLKQCAIQALGRERGSKIKFKDLRDAFNEIIKNHPGLKGETVDRLMGHTVGAKNSYVTGAMVLNAYREVFPKLSVNGWLLEKRAEGFDELSGEIQALREALEQSERENTAYRTRTENLQDRVTGLETTLEKNIKFMQRTFYALTEKLDLTDENLLAQGMSVEELARVKAELKDEK